MDTSGGQRKRDPPGADGKFQRRAAPCQLLQERDGFNLIATFDVIVPFGGVFAKLITGS